MRCMLILVFPCWQVFAGTMSLSVHVAGENAVPITNAVVKVSRVADPLGRFVDSPRKIRESNTVDRTGCWQKKMNLHSASVFLHVSAPGYYPEDTNLHFRIKSDSALLGPQFMDASASVPFVLRRMKNPIPMYSYGTIHGLRFPARSGRFGMDLKTGDWVKPHGAGETADFFVDVPPGDSAKPDSADVVFQGCGEGFYRAHKHPSRSFWSVYCVDTNALFSTRLHLRDLDDFSPVPPGEGVSKDEYLVLRTRVRVDEEGRIVEANYSKIYGPMGTQDGRFFFFSSVFNPTANDTNLEFDPNQNLIPRSKKRHMCRFVP